MNKLDLWRVNALLVLYATLFVAEFLVNQITHSVLILIDAYYNLFVFTTLILLLVSHKTSKDQSIRNTFGWVRISILGRLITQCFFAALAFALLVESTQLLIHSMHEQTNIQPRWNLISSIASLIGHLLSYSLISRLLNQESSTMSIHGTHVQMHFVVRPQESLKDSQHHQIESELKLISGDSTHQLQSRLQSTASIKKLSKFSTKNEKDAKLKCNNSTHSVQSNSGSEVIVTSESVKLLRTLCSSVLLLLASCAQMLTILPNFANQLPHWFVQHQAQQLLDPICGILAVFIICVLIYPDMKQSGLILLQTMPSYINLTHLQRKLLKKFPSVLGIHELHIWCLTKSQTIATCHLLLADQFKTHATYTEFIEQMNELFRQEGISRVTVQPEFLNDSGTGLDTSAQELLRLRLEYADLDDRCLFLCPASTGDCAQKLCCHQKDDQGQCSQRAV